MIRALIPGVIHFPTLNNGRGLPATEGRQLLLKGRDWFGTNYAPINEGSKAEMQVAADCSGSVHGIYVQGGYDYSYRNSKNFADAATQGDIPFRKLDVYEVPQAADVVLYTAHMSMYSENNHVFSAHREGMPFGEFTTSYFITPNSKLIGYYRYQLPVSSGQ
ncbi:MAG: hypothetical protein HY016_11085 [Nitrosomonadales bacterium]|nr:hypothetical protein [Nitrosomonadales bacterium]